MSGAGADLNRKYGTPAVAAVPSAKKEGDAAAAAAAGGSAASSSSSPDVVAGILASSELVRERNSHLHSLADADLARSLALAVLERSAEAELSQSTMAFETGSDDGGEGAGAAAAASPSSAAARPAAGPAPARQPPVALMANRVTPQGAGAGGRGRPQWFASTATPAAVTKTMAQLLAAATPDPLVRHLSADSPSPASSSSSSSAALHSRPGRSAMATVQSLLADGARRRSVVAIANLTPQLSIEQSSAEAELLERTFDCVAGAGLRRALRRGHAYQVSRVCNDILDVRTATVRVPPVQPATVEQLRECDAVQFASILIIMAEAYRLRQDRSSQANLHDAFLALYWALECMEAELGCSLMAFAIQPGTPGSSQVKLGDEAMHLNTAELDKFDRTCMAYARLHVQREELEASDTMLSCVAAWAGRVYSRTLQQLAAVIQHDLVSDSSSFSPAIPPQFRTWDTAEQLVGAAVAVQCSSLMRGNWEAWVTILPLAEHAVDRQQYGRAEHLYHQALSLLEKSPALKDDAPTRVAYAHLLRFLGQLYNIVAHQSREGVASPRIRAMLEQAAIPALVKSTQYHPRSDTTLIELGSCHALLGNFSKALEFYQAAVAIKPSSVQRHLDLAALHISNGDQPSLLAAKDILERHLFNKDGQLAFSAGSGFSAYHNLVTVRRELGRFDAAIDLLKAMHAQSPSCLTSYQLTRTIRSVDHVDLLLEHIKYSGRQ